MGILKKKPQRQLMYWEEQALLLKKRQEEQNRLLDRALRAKAEYKETKEVDKAIQTFEELDNLGLISSWNQLFLVDLYLDKGQSDKAWGYLNSLCINPNNPGMDRIRRKQAQILEKEKRYREAFQCRMLEFAGLPQIPMDAFEKAVKKLVKPLGLTPENVRTLGTIAMQTSDEREIVDKYNTFMDARDTV